MVTPDRGGGQRIGYARVSTRSRTSRCSSTRSSRPAAHACSATSARARSASARSSRRAWTTCAPATRSWYGGSTVSVAACATSSTSSPSSSSDTSRSNPYASRSTPPPPAGKLQLHIFAALAEFERELIRERSQAGREVAKAAGRLGGRPIKLTPEKRAAALAMRERGDMTMARSPGPSGSGARPCTTTCDLPPLDDIPRQDNDELAA